MNPIIEMLATKPAYDTGSPAASPVGVGLIVNRIFEFIESGGVVVDGHTVPIQVEWSPDSPLEIRTVTTLPGQEWSIRSSHSIPEDCEIGQLLSGNEISIEGRSLQLHKLETPQLTAETITIPVAIAVKYGIYWKVTAIHLQRTGARLEIWGVPALLEPQFHWEPRPGKTSPLAILAVIRLLLAALSLFGFLGRSKSRAK